MNYQISKTIRFGLTPHSKTNKCHTAMVDLVNSSNDLIFEEAKKNNVALISNTQSLLECTKKCLDDINTYLRRWVTIQKRKDLLFLSFEYYVQLARKAKFDARWIDKNNKNQPSKNKLVSLKLLAQEHNNERKVDYIFTYWNNNLLDTKQKSEELSNYLGLFQTALQENQTHQSLNLVEFRKICLQLFRLVNETLTPLHQNLITLDNKREQLADKDKYIGKFFDELPILVSQIEKLKTYFSENGGYVPYGRVTLNKKTACQKPHKFDFEDVFKKENFITHHFVKELYNYVINFKDNDNEDNKDTKDKITKAVEQFFKQKNNKKNLYYDKNLCLLERVQYFKYKNIPLAVRYPLADYFAKKNKDWDIKILRKIFDVYGNPISLDKEYAENNASFKFEHYPLKPAFDVAWENVAKSIYDNTINAPLEKGKEYLKKYFGINEDNPRLQLYAHLLELNKNLAVLDHTDAGQEARIEAKDKIEKAIKKLEIIDDLKKNHLPQIQARLEDDKLYFKQDKLNSTFKTQYERAKQQLGQLRAEQKLGKTERSTYFCLTESFKEVSKKYGNGFSALRDKLSENTNLNKIDYLGIIIEDKNKDRYILMQPLNEDRKEVENLFLNEAQGDYTFYEVHSLTAKALEKLIKNPNSENSKNLHNNLSKLSFDLEKIKKHWKIYKDTEEFITYLKDCLTNSKMAQEQNWKAFNLEIEHCKTFDEISKEIDKKCYKLNKGKISKGVIENYIKQGAKLLPIVNQDITSQTKELKNQFSKDWKSIFEENALYRLHPEFAISYRMPTPNYPKPEEKRYSRFQMIGQFLVEHHPSKEKNYLSRKEQTTIFNNKEEYEKLVNNINEAIGENRNERFVIGIDRGRTQLATLCLLDPQGHIQGGFKIYERTATYKDDGTFYRFEHQFKEERNILDLSNLRVETTLFIDGQEKKDKVLVDLSLIPVAIARDKQNKPLKNANGEIETRENKQKFKLKKMAYWRKIQYAFMNNETNEAIYSYLSVNIKTLREGELTQDFIKTIPHISPFGEGKSFADFPTEDFRQLALKFMEHKKNNTLNALNAELELDAVDDLKKGIVANMIGVIGYIIDWVYTQHHTIPLISLENLCRAWGYGKDGLTNNILPQSFNKSNITNDKITFKEQENLKLAGLSLYHFFEMQLLKKLMKLNLERHYPYLLVPPVRAVKDYEIIAQLTKYENRENGGSEEYVCKQPFGIVYFVDPDHTSKKCPICEAQGKANITREGDNITCKKCGDKVLGKKVTNEMKKKFIAKIADKSKHPLIEHNVLKIKNADDNAAYHIALKTLKKLKQDGSIEALAKFAIIKPLKRKNKP